MKKSILFLLLLISSCLFAQTEEIKCGSDRWSVKTLTDSNVSQVDFKHVVKSSVYKQTLFEGHDIKANTPRLEDETTVYRITGWLIEYRTEADNDLHLVIKDDKSDSTMVAEICDPSCPGLKKSPAYKKFVTVRKKFKKFYPKKSMKNILNHIQIEGVGFFDKKHSISPKGNAWNNREIHPVTKLKFL